MKQTRLILVGGFLGAGKTTLLWETAVRLMNKGLRVGLITNDQAPELVDSELLKLSDLRVAEVSGSCFCCNFNGFTDAIKEIRAEASADVIIAEPVGSCTDLSATIMQPLKQYWNTELKISPLTVLADPNRLVSILNGGNGGLHPDAAYIYKKQLEESDIILLSKSDVLKREETAVLRQRLSDAFPGATVLSASAQTGEGMDKWIEAVMSRQDAGKRLLEIDYDTYAHGEAVLGWLNGTLQLHGVSDDWDDFLKTLMKGFAVKFDEAGCAVGHVKVIAENGKRFAVGNLTGKQDTLSLRGSAGAGDHHCLQRPESHRGLLPDVSGPGPREEDLQPGTLRRSSHDGVSRTLSGRRERVHREALPLFEPSLPGGERGGGPPAHRGDEEEILRCPPQLLVLSH